MKLGSSKEGAALDRDKLATQYKEIIRTAENEMSDLAEKKKKLEELRQGLFDLKRRDMAYLNQLHHGLRGEGAKRDRRMIENILEETQHLTKRVEQQLEQESFEIERKRKQVSARTETAQAEYRRAQRNLNKGGMT